MKEIIPLEGVQVVHLFAGKSTKINSTDITYSFIKEAVRITEPGGYICILHQLVYLTPKNTERYAVIGVTTGPNMRIRVLNIFKRETQTEKKLNDYG